MATLSTAISPQQEGLTSEQARDLLKRVGPNVIAESRRTAPLRQFLANFVQLLALLLWIGAALAVVAGMPALAVAIIAVIVINAVFAFIQEYRAERAIAALRHMLPVRVRVRRDGQTKEIASEEVVPGDVLLLAAGDRIAADAELIHARDLRVDASALTGESVPVAPDREVFAGTYVVAGTAEARVTATGMATRFGRIAALSQETPRARSPLERELDHLTRMIALVAISAGGLFFIVAGLAGIDLQSRFVFAIGVTVALVPEGLLPTVTFALALAAQRMARRNALVRRLSLIETLGETTVICADKTGTLTQNQMTVQRIWTREAEITVEGVGYTPVGRFLLGGAGIDPAPLHELLRGALLCNNARLMRGPTGWSAIGDPTEAALIVLAEKGGLHHERETARAPRIFELPFNSERKRMTTVHLLEGQRIAYVKGAAEVILPRTTLDEKSRAMAAAAESAMEREALRVLAIARRVLPQTASFDADSIEQELEFLGLVGVFDPPRPEVPPAVRRCREAGIRIIMVTGDSARTAEAIARRIGLLEGDALVITGAELARLDDEALRRIVARRDVIFARIDPEHKLRLARALRAAGEVVAMTGDGVNDAPALKCADIGIAMGMTGTDVAKEAADLILVDDNFASIVAAIEEGRAIYADIRKFTGYHFCSNVAEVVPFLVWGLSGGLVPLPLHVMQVLAIDLGTDQLPALALGTERAEPGTMARPPRPRSERLLNGTTIARIFGWMGPLEALAAMSSFLFAYVLSGWQPWEPLADSGPVYREATTMTMAAIVTGQIGAAIAWRTDRLSIREIGILTNRLLLIGIAIEVAMVAMLAYVPALAEIFHASPLGLWHWLFLLLWPAVVLGAEEARKALLRRG